ncbi:MAG: histidinol-phosphate aminotransferase family protein [Proteobacteria bacterium]|nr:histidinol-phosphate aminotransferase family protein [Pseudomonadota bacterium]
MTFKTLQTQLEDKISSLPIVGPYKKYKQNIQADINLSDNLNHFLEKDSYPPFECEALKNLYTNILIEDDPSLSFLKKKLIDSFFINGALEAVSVLLETFCQPLDSVLTFTPTFPFYKDICNRMGFRFNEVSLEGKNLDELNIENAQKFNPKVILICDPNNPTSTRINSSNIEKTLERFKNSLIIIDEAYIDFSSTSSNLRFVNTYSNLIVVRGLSKGWGMASLRLCAIFASHTIIECLKRSSVAYPISKLSIEKALFKFSFEKELVRNSWKLVKEEKKRLTKELTQFSKIQKIYPSDTNFLCLTLKNATDLHHHLLMQGILVENVQHIIPNCLRITIGKPSENDMFLKALSSF